MVANNKSIMSARGWITLYGALALIVAIEALCNVPSAWIVGTIVMGQIGIILFYFKLKSIVMELRERNEELARKAAEDGSDIITLSQREYSKLNKKGFIRLKNGDTFMKENISVYSPKK